MMLCTLETNGIFPFKFVSDYLLFQSELTNHYRYTIRFEELSISVKHSLSVASKVSRRSSAFGNIPRAVLS